MTKDKFNSLSQEIGNLFSYVSGADNYELIYMNKNLMNHLRISDNKYLGSHCYEVIYGFSQPCYFCTKNKLKLGKTQRFYKYNPKLQRYLVSKTSVIQTDIGFTHMCVSYDVSKQFEQIKELKETLGLDNAIVECAKTMFYNENIDISLNMLLKTVCDFYQSERSFILEINEENQTFSSTYEYTSISYVGDCCKLVDIPIDSLENVLYMISEGKLTYANLSLEMLPSKSKELAFLKEYKLDKLLLAPLYKRGKIIGFVGIANSKQNNDTHELIYTIATFIINDLSKRYVRQDLETTVSDLNNMLLLSNTMLKCANALLEGHDYDRSIVNLLETICDFYVAERADIFQLNKTGDKLINTHQFSGLEDDTVKFEDLQTHLFKEWFDKLEQNYIIYIDSKKREYKEGSMAFQYMSFAGIETYLVVSLRLKGKLIGFLGIVNPTNVKSNNTDLLQTVSAFVMNYFQKSDMINKLEDLSFSDKLTGLKNRNCYLHVLDKLKKQQLENFGIIFADVNGLKKANDNLGHEYGDILIRWCGNFLMKNMDCDVYRIGGDEFVAFIHNLTSAEFYNKIQIMRNTLFKMDILNMSMGGSYQVLTENIEKQIVETDKIMYLEKRKYYILKQVTGANLEEDLEQLRIRIEDLKKDLEN